LRNAYGTGDLYSAGPGARATLPHAFRLGIEAAFLINATRYETGDSAPPLRDRHRHLLTHPRVSSSPLSGEVSGLWPDGGV
jgi:hypothetical protein